MKFDREMRQALRAWNLGTAMARREYALHPSIAAEEDLCQGCGHPRVKERCHVCRAHQRKRARRGRNTG